MPRRKPPLPPFHPDPDRRELTAPGHPGQAEPRAVPSPLVGGRLHGSLADIARRLAQGRPALAGWAGYVDCPGCRVLADAGHTFCLLTVDHALAVALVDCRRCGARYHRVAPVRALLEGRPVRWVPLPDEPRGASPPSKPPEAGGGLR